MNPCRGSAASIDVSATTRWSMFGLAVVLMFGFAVSRGLEPSRSGFGTHTQLGLPPCQFAVMTGQRCPSCGMTTAFAWFVRGRLDRSVRANPAGTLLAASCMVLVPWLIVGAALGKTPGFRSFEQPLIAIAAATLAASLISWTFRLFVGD